MYYSKRSNFYPRVSSYQGSSHIRILLKLLAQAVQSAEESKALCTLGPALRGRMCQSGWVPCYTVTSPCSSASSLGKALQTREQEVCSERLAGQGACSRCCGFICQGGTSASNGLPGPPAATIRLCCQDVGFGFCFSFALDLGY